MSTFTVSAGDTAPDDSNGMQLVIGPASRSPWLLNLASGCFGLVYFDFQTSSILFKRFGWQADGTYALGTAVTVATGIADTGFSAFCNSQKVAVSFLDTAAGLNRPAVRFAVSFNDGDSWTLDQAAG